MTLCLRESSPLLKYQLFEGYLDFVSDVDDKILCVSADSLACRYPEARDEGDIGKICFGFCGTDLGKYPRTVQYAGRSSFP
jgi:hypothetical protein